MNISGVATAARQGGIRGEEGIGADGAPSKDAGRGNEIGVRCGDGVDRCRARGRP